MRDFRDKKDSKNKSSEINEQIRDREIRVIGAEGEQLGVMSSREAQQLADEKKLDLVKIAPTAKPPVCRIMDFGKFKYEQTKREKEARKKQKNVQVKEVRLGLNIEDNDMNTKAKNAIKFLEKGDKVKVSIRFRGRELGHTNLGYGVMEKFDGIIGEYGTQDKRPKMEGRSMIVIYTPKK